MFSSGAMSDVQPSPARSRSRAAWPVRRGAEAGEPEPPRRRTKRRQSRAASAGGRGADRPCKSAWVDRDAEAAVARYAGRAARSCAARLHHAAARAPIRKLVLHGGGNTSLKTQAPDLNGDEVDVLCVKGSGCDMADDRAGRPAGGAARTALRSCARATRLSDEDFIRMPRANLIDPAAPTPSVETAAACLHAGEVHRPHPRDRGAQPDRPAERRRSVRRGLWRPHGHRALCDAGLRARRAAADVFDANPKVEGLILLKHGIFTFGADAREAYERMIEMVTLRRRAARARAQGVFATAQLPQQIAPRRRGRADPARRVQPEGREDRGRVEALHPGIPRRRRGAEFRQRRGASRATARPAW